VSIVRELVIRITSYRDTCKSKICGRVFAI